MLLSPDLNINHPNAYKQLYFNDTLLDFWEYRIFPISLLHSLHSSYLNLNACSFSHIQSMLVHSGYPDVVLLHERAEVSKQRGPFLSSDNQTLNLNVINSVNISNYSQP
jgi:hypothetical protein